MKEEHGNEEQLAVFKYSTLSRSTRQKQNRMSHCGAKDGMYLDNIGPPTMITANNANDQQKEDELFQSAT